MSLFCFSKSVLQFLPVNGFAHFQSAFQFFLYPLKFCSILWLKGLLCFFSLDRASRLLATQGVFFGKQRTSLVEWSSLQNPIYSETQSVKPSMSSPCVSHRASQSVTSREAHRDSTTSGDYHLTLVCCCWTTGLYDAESQTNVWSDLPRGGSALELYAFLTFAYSRSKIPDCCPLCIWQTGRRWEGCRRERHGWSHLWWWWRFQAFLFVDLQ